MFLTLPVLYVHQAVAEKMAHKEYASMKITECNSCHKAEGVAPNHTADWGREHRLLASKGGHNCAQCHDQSYCLDCHSGGGIDTSLTKQNYRADFIPKSHRSDFINIHPIKALDNPQTCSRCHEASFCSDCHNRFPKGSLRIKSHLRSGNSQSFNWTSEHAAEARRNLQSCQTCHPEGDVCTSCHGSKSRGFTGVNPHPKSFKGGNISSRTSRTCKACH